MCGGVEVSGVVHGLKAAQMGWLSAENSASGEDEELNFFT